MTIDEAIVHAREVASRMFDDRVHCIKCAEEHEQLAKWLEELKQYRAIGKVSTCQNAVEVCRAMIERGIEPDNIKEYIAFEDNLVQKGYDLKRLLEMMEEHKQYRAIGTPEECQAAVEKQTAKKVENSGEHIPFEWYCPTCGNTLCDDGWKDTEIAFCEECGQKINWGNDENKPKKLGQIIAYGKTSKTVRGW